jgi:hypothetical protein
MKLCFGSKSDYPWSQTVELFLQELSMPNTREIPDESPPLFFLVAPSVLDPDVDHRVSGLCQRLSGKRR